MLEFIALGREIIMEPEWVNKIQSGKISEIRTTLSKNDRESLDIPEPLWNAIINTPGWFPITDINIYRYNLHSEFIYQKCQI